jgi:hypothetical protein
VRDPQEAREDMPRDVDAERETGGDLPPDVSGPGTGIPAVAPSEVGG